MLIQAPSPKGIDFRLQKYQTDLHTFLLDLWGIDTNDYRCYDRCYKNENKNGFIPEVYNQNGSYSEISIDDKHKVTSFFGMGSKVDYSSENNLNTADVHLIFVANLAKLKSTTARPDEEIRQDVQNFAQHELYGFLLEGIDNGIEVFSEYTGLKIKYRDMQPLHCFRLNFKVSYPFNDHQCT